MYERVFTNYISTWTGTSRDRGRRRRDLHLSKNSRSELRSAFKGIGWKRMFSVSPRLQSASVGTFAASQSERVEKVVFGYFLLMWKLEGNGKTLSSWQKVFIVADSSLGARGRNPECMFDRFSSARWHASKIKCKLFIFLFARSNWKASEKKETFHSREKKHKRPEFCLCSAWWLCK